MTSTPCFILAFRYTGHKKVSLVQLWKNVDLKCSTNFWNNFTMNHTETVCFHLQEVFKFSKEIFFKVMCKK